ncbi:polyamine ABC transporter substrate-binding protein [Aurantimonas sp. MSK8Z-1]|uniref:polyamine ABC transporter substrate-binding protein n=1 Tax=Mangrovibrevibacter kandeliae TaxID=2968473 RepID=UPI0021177E6C|nr:polyamine ABC transporter substrate-binding protein [Aurantimonas sp. MSK8Z-1]MCW4113559.1 polyamine ABC transporter substrate-binding protein [Aurantimonas sp. MSK8Z-1]
MKLQLAAWSAGAALLALVSAAQAQEQVVNVYNWSDYIDESVLADFTKETGIKVVYDVFDSNEILETKLLAGGSGYDVVVPSAEFLARQIQAGVVQKLDKSKLTNLGNMWDVVSDRLAQYPDMSDYSVNYMWGTTGIGYNTKKVAEALPDAPTDSLALVLDPKNAEKLASCGIDILDSPSDIMSMTLNYLGLDPNSTNPDDIQKAEDALLKIRPYVRKFHSSEYINGLANGDICVALGYSGDVFQARDRAADAGQGVDIAYSIPKEGTIMWFDQLAIPADAPHVDNAHTFINYLMRPEVIAKATNYVVYANGNKASQQFVEPEILEDKAVYPDQATMDKLYVKRPYDARTQRVVTRAFTTVKTGQ